MESPPPLTTLQFFAETAQLWTLEALGATDGGAVFMNKNANIVDRLGNAEYGYAVVKLLHEELLVTLCVLKCGGGITELLTAMEAVPSL